MADSPEFRADSPEFRADSPGIRVGDRDRQQTIDFLTTAYGEGRLEMLEFEDRVAKAQAARVQADLDSLTTDLPVPRSPAPPAPTSSPVSSVRGRFRREYGVFFIAPVICTVIYAMVDFGGYFWPMWVWFGCMIPVALALFFRD